MNLGISTASLYTKFATENCFSALRDIGVDTTEVFFSSFSEYEKGFVDALVTRQNGMKVHSVHAVSNQFEGELFAKTQRVRDDAEQLFRKICYGANALGAKYYTFHGPLSLKKSPSTVSDPGEIAEHFNRLSIIARTYGVTIAVENVHYCKFSTPEIIKSVLKACPSLMATVDVKHALYSGYDPIRFIDAVQDRLVTLHVNDVDRDDNTALPGKGRFNFEKFFKEVSKRDIHSTVLIEAYPKDFTYMTEIADSYKYLKEIIDNL
ncbi:MAG: sugar phosphate isomerase/epimerase [Clostridia bacterium]|nr:sugar phosphate isomerase/epimerase [Clostridia bacterium]